MLHFIKYLVTFIFIFEFNILLAQENYYQKYTTEHGLLSNIIYDATIDANSFIWLATENGVCKFDGSYFKVFSKNNGLTDNVCFCVLYEPSTNRIWTELGNGEIIFLENDIVFTKHNNIMLKQLNRVRHDLHMSMSNQNEMLFATDDSIFIVKQNQLTVIPRRSNLVYENYFIGYVKNLISCRNGQLLQSNSLIINPSQEIHQRRYVDIDSVSKRVTAIIDNVIYQSEDNQRIEMNNEFKQNKINIVGLYRFQKSFLIATNNGVYSIEANCILKPSKKLLDNIPINGFLTDSNGNTWCLTNGQGLIKIPSQEIFQFQATENFNTIALGQNQEIVAGKWNGDLTFITKNNSSIFNIRKEPLEASIRKIIYFKGRFHVLTNKQIVAINPRQNYAIEKIVEGSTLKSFSIDPDETIHVSSRDYIESFKDKRTLFKYKFKESNRTYCIIHDKKFSYYLGSEKGLIYLDTFQQEHILLRDRINQMSRISVNEFVCATENSGIVYCLDGQIKSQLLNNKNNATICNSIYYDMISKSIYVGTNQGLFIFHIFNHELILLRHLGSNYGLMHLQIADIIGNQTHIFLASNKGILMLNRNMRLYENKIAHLYINQIKSNGKEIGFYNNLNLGKNVHNIELEAKSITNGQDHEIRYRFYYNQKSSDTFYSDNGKMAITNLEVGTYSLVIESFLVENPHLTNRIFFTFRIEPNWWQTFLFKALITFILIALICFAIYFYFIKEKKKIQIQNQHLHLEIQALRSQMNPHFIFNSLNAVQEFIFANKPREANKFISNFSKLVRISLLHSNKNEISIQQEIDFLELYIQSEQIRFDNKFLYEITVDDKLVADYTFIPSFILQPIVENAIIHGISHLKTEGKLMIRFTKMDDSICCKVEDNGIGRAKSEALKSDKNNAIAMNNIISRIELINQTLTTKRITYAFFDKSETDNSNSGTIFELLIPANFSG